MATSDQGPRCGLGQPATPQCSLHVKVSKNLRHRHAAARQKLLIADLRAQLCSALEQQEALRSIIAAMQECTSTTPAPSASSAETEAGTSATIGVGNVSSALVAGTPQSLSSPTLLDQEAAIRAATSAAMASALKQYSSLEQAECIAADVKQAILDLALCAFSSGAEAVASAAIGVGNNTSALVAGTPQSFSIYEEEDAIWQRPETASADAAAGAGDSQLLPVHLQHSLPAPGSGTHGLDEKDFNSQNLANTVGLFADVKTGVVGSPGTLGNASPRVFDAISEDFNSQDLANLPQCGPSAFTQLRTADEPCETAGMVTSPTPPTLAVKGVGSPRTTPSNFNSQNLANTVERLVDGGSSNDNMASCPAGPIKASEPPAMSCSQQASFFAKHDNSKMSSYSEPPENRRCETLKDFNSQNLAYASELSTLKDFTSQNLAVTSGIPTEEISDFNSQNLANVEFVGAGVATVSTTLGRFARADDESSMGASQAFNSQDLALLPGDVDAIADGLPVAFNSQDLANRPQCGPCASDFNSQNLANSVERLGVGVSSEDAEQLGHIATASTTLGRFARADNESSKGTSQVFNSQDLAFVPGDVDAIAEGVPFAFNSQDLANRPQYGPSVSSEDTGAFAHCTPGSSRPGSSNCAVGQFSFKASSGTSSYCEGCDDNQHAHKRYTGTQCGQFATVYECGPLRTDAASELFDANAGGGDSSDFKSQDLARINEPLLDHRSCTASPEPLDAIAHDDFNSSNLANTSEHLSECHGGSSGADAPPPVQQECNSPPLDFVAQTQYVLKLESAWEMLNATLSRDNPEYAGLFECCLKHLEVARRQLQDMRT